MRTARFLLALPLVAASLLPGPAAAMVAPVNSVCPIAQLQLASQPVGLGLGSARADGLLHCRRGTPAVRATLRLELVGRAAGGRLVVRGSVVRIATIRPGQLDVTISASYGGRLACDAATWTATLRFTAFDAKGGSVVSGQRRTWVDGGC